MGKPMSIHWIGLTVCTVLSIRAFAASAPVREVTSQAMLVGNQPVPGFYQGFLFFVDHPRSSQITLYAPDGHLTLQRDMETGKQLRVSVMSIAVDSDGTAAISWSQSPLSSGSHAGIDLLDGTGKPVGSIDTGGYLPSHVAFGEDHTVWSFGWQRDENLRDRESKTDYMTVRHFSVKGQLGAYLPRSLFPQGLQPACFNWQERGIEVARDRVGVLSCSGMTDGDPEWVELDLTGNLIGRWRVDFSRTITLTKDGHVYAQDTNSKARQLVVLDRPSSAFKPVDWLTTGTLYGSDGNELVFADTHSRGPIHLSWYKQP